MKSFFKYESDAQYLLQPVKVLRDNRFGVIVDYSNAHGLEFGVVFPNTHGRSGRQDMLEVNWFEPEEVEIL